MHALTSNKFDFQLRKHFSIPEVMEISGVRWCCPAFAVLAEFSSSCLSVWTTKKKEASSMGEESEWWNLSAFSWAAEGNRHFYGKVCFTPECL